MCVYIIGMVLIFVGCLGSREAKVHASDFNHACIFICTTAIMVGIMVIEKRVTCNYRACTISMSSVQL